MTTPSSTVPPRNLRTPFVANGDDAENDGGNPRELGAVVVLSVMVAFAVCLCVSSWYAARKQKREEPKMSNEEEEKRNIIRSALEANFMVMVVAAADLHSSPTDSDIRETSSGSVIKEKSDSESYDMSDLDSDTVLLLPNITKSNTVGSPRAVSATCIVCFEDYQAGETVTWSHNPNCVHCFHRDCFVEASVRMLTNNNKNNNRNERQLPCLVCRQCFLTDVVLEQNSSEEGEKEDIPESNNV